MLILFFNKLGVLITIWIYDFFLGGGVYYQLYVELYEERIWTDFYEMSMICRAWYKEQMIKLPDYYMGPFLLTWFNFNPSMDK